MAAEEYDTVVRAARAIVAGAERAVSLGIRSGRIATLDADADLPADLELAADEVLLPGLVDTHVHVNEPGRTAWEGFESATSAAASGGVTTIVDMPLNSIPPTTTLDGLRAKQAVARDRVRVDVGFWGGAVPGNVADLAELHAAGVLGFKCFLLPSGVEEFPELDGPGLRETMTELARLDALLLVHAEDGAEIAPEAPHSRAYADFLRSRPPAAENAAIERVVEAARATGARAHVVHLSSADALPVLRAARGDGVRVTVETCPHYLGFCAEEIPDGATQLKCCPPIRDAGNRDRLWAGLVAGDIDLVVTDHSPCTADLKRFDTGDFGDAWGGIASLQLGLPAVWTEARKRGLGLGDVVRWMCERPADLVGLAHKGRIAVGADADLCVLAPEETFTVDPARLRHRNPVSAWAGRTLTGTVRQTWLRGVRLDPDGAPRGRLLERGDA
ncbi:allantoinase AllB [Nocardioides coralli]|uniref:allantoinase AllB n=1 Tax=Nocardioides coralli TaxID=2872154 RepID=UPI001CA3D911|nr:allantoinase AllB [Nocardioides coralli]QZY29856.1 allantoinase AllB [Nocardioides coralli]